MNLMRILVEIGHPANVHFFKHVIRELERRGHNVLICVREREGMVGKLLDIYGFDFKYMIATQKGLARKALALPLNELLLLKYCLKFKPDVMIGRSSPYVSHVAFLLHRPFIVYEDTEVAFINHIIAFPFITSILVNTGYELNFNGPVRKKIVTVPSYKELAYLHPKRFTPDPSVLEALGISPDERIILMRLSARDSSHDFGVQGLKHDTESMLDAIRKLEDYGRVFLTSELPLNRKLRAYRPSIGVHRIHDLLAHATLYIGEGATMAAEAGVLGVPWIFVSNQSRGYLSEMAEKYKLGYIVSGHEHALSKAIDILETPGIGDIWKERRCRLLQDKIDFVDYIVNYVESFAR